MLRRALLLAMLSFPAMGQSVDPAAIAYRLPEQIPWGPVTANGNQQAVLVGDPSRPGFYAVMVRWLPGHMSRPHYHPNDRHITVISGTWWMGSGTSFDPASTVPVGPGSFVTHFARGIHYEAPRTSRRSS